MCVEIVNTANGTPIKSETHTLTTVQMCILAPAIEFVQSHLIKTDTKSDGKGK